MRTLLFILCIWPCAQLKAQQSGAIAKDTAYNSQFQRTNVFLDNFDDNRNGWINMPKDKTVAIKDGQFYINSKTDYRWGVEIPFDVSRNFEMEFVTRIRKKNFLAEGKFYWGDNCGADRISMAFFRGDIYIVPRENGKGKKMISINKKLPVMDTYKYTIRKIDTEYLFYANEQFVGRMLYKQLYGQ